MTPQSPKPEEEYLDARAFCTACGAGPGIECEGACSRRQAACPKPERKTEGVDLEAVKQELLHIEARNKRAREDGYFAHHCIYDGSRMLEIIPALLDRIGELEKENRAETRRLEFLLNWLGMNDCDKPLPTRDWDDNEDARRAVDEYLDGLPEAP